MKKPKKTRDALDLLDERYGKDDPNWFEDVAKEREKFEVGMQLYKLRTKHGLTQRELAKLVGTSHSNIARLEDAQYEGHSMSMLRRIAEALDSRVEVRIVKNRAKRQPPAPPRQAP